MRNSEGSNPSRGTMRNKRLDIVETRRPARFGVVADLVDASDLGSDARKSRRVRIPLTPPASNQAQPRRQVIASPTSLESGRKLAR